MAFLKRVERVTFATDNLLKWGWFYLDVLKGRRIERIPPEIERKRGVSVCTVDFGEFDVELIEPKSRMALTHTKLAKHGDGILVCPHFVAEDFEAFRRHIGGYGFKEQTPDSIFIEPLQSVFIPEKPRSSRSNAGGMLKRVDHITYVVRPDTIERWMDIYTNLLGGKPGLKVDDTNPNDASSMMLWTIDFDNFGIALVAGIDRTEKSHVTAFADRHGDHTCQHVAFQVDDLEQFLAYTSKFGMHLQGEILVRRDDRGWIKQVFSGNYHDDNNPSEVGFHEFVERPKTKGGEFPEVSFDKNAGKNLYQQAQKVMKEDRRETMVDFSLMPDGWRLPQAEKL